MSTDHFALVITAGSTLLAAITGVLIAAGLDARRRQRDAMREVRRLLRLYEEAAAQEIKTRGKKGTVDRVAIDRRADSLLDEIEVLTTEMPPRHLAGYVSAAVEVLRVKHSIYEPNENRVVWQVRRSTDTALSRASTTPLLWWWLYRRWRRAAMTPQMRDYVDYLPDIYELYEQNYEAQREWWEEKRKERLRSERDAERENGAIGSVDT